MTYITYLHRYRCGNHFDPDTIQMFCPDCQIPLLTLYEPDAARVKLDRDEFRHCPLRIWCWRELLPVREYTNMVSLGKRDIPILHLSNLGPEPGLSQLYVKDKSLNPTGSFKARVGHGHLESERVRSNESHPTGGGAGRVGMWKAFKEMKSIGC